MKKLLIFMSVTIAMSIIVVWILIPPAYMDDLNDFSASFEQIPLPEDAIQIGQSMVYSGNISIGSEDQFGFFIARVIRSQLSKEALQGYYDAFFCESRGRKEKIQVFSLYGPAQEMAVSHPIHYFTYLAEKKVPLPDQYHSDRNIYFVGAIIEYDYPVVIGEMLSAIYSPFKSNFKINFRTIF